jgi:hypothetical protein
MISGYLGIATQVVFAPSYRIRGIKSESAHFKQILEDPFYPLQWWRTGWEKKQKPVVISTYSFYD